jgi:hypothetical protein
LAREGRLENFLERMTDKKITYTDYTSQRDALITRLQVAEAKLRIDETQFQATRLAAMIDTKAPNREPWTLLEPVSARAVLGHVFSVVKEAVDVLNTGGGDSWIYSDVPVHRIRS